MRCRAVIRARSELQSIDHLDLTTKRVRRNFLDRVMMKDAMAASWSACWKRGRMEATEPLPARAVSLVA